METMIDASVVICAYTMDRWDDLNAAVDSARRQTRPAREIIVVVDNNDVLLERAKREIDGAVVAPNTNVRGLCGGRMTGAELASAPVIAFLDDDAIADECWLEELLAGYENDRVLGVGGRIEPLWRVPRPWWFPLEFDWVVGCTYQGMRIHNGQIDRMIGANMSVRADVLHGSGGFPFPHLGRDGGRADDTEFCIRAARLYGGVWMYRPRASVKHVVTAERATWKYFLRRCRMEGDSKAVLTDLAGSKDGLRSERRYVLILAQSILRYICTGKLGWVMAICVGLAITTITYGRARLAHAIQARRGMIYGSPSD
jgi:glycosyltransferase involved in cell wall biosynthesis